MRDTENGVAFIEEVLSEEESQTSEDSWMSADYQEWHDFWNDYH